jgi:magnesium chelatase subunit I
MDWNRVILHPGNEELKRFIEIGVLAAQLGIPLHFHVEGVRGTGKTTLIRAAKSLFPFVTRIDRCLYNCDPQAPQCPEHRMGDDFVEEKVRMPFLEVSHSAKVGTVVGSIDLDKLTATENPEAAILPGTVPRANRGIVFVDEVNRLADTSPPLVDVLLDVMGTKPGRVQIEETGLPTVEMPVNVSVWAASNPDEEPGPLQEIRRQLADRFDFVVRIERPQEAGVVRAIMHAAENHHGETASFAALNYSSTIATLADSVDEFLGELYIRFRLESIRGVQAIRLGTQLHAMVLGKTVADFSDMAAVLPAALRHRIDPPRMQEITEAMREAANKQSKKNDVPPANIKGEVKDRKSYRNPALWRGLWQRLSNRQTNSGGKSVSVNTKKTTHGNDSPTEKKTVTGTGEPEVTKELVK